MRPVDTCFDYYVKWKKFNLLMSLYFKVKLQTYLLICQFSFNGTIRVKYHHCGSIKHIFLGWSKGLL